MPEVNVLLYTNIIITIIDSSTVTIISNIIIVGESSLQRKKGRELWSLQIKRYCAL